MTVITVFSDEKGSDDDKRERVCDVVGRPAFAPRPGDIRSTFVRVRPLQPHCVPTTLTS